MEYELYNPSDPYTFIAESREVAAIVVALISTTYGADTQDGNPENHIPIFLFGGFDGGDQHNADTRTHSVQALTLFPGDIVRFEQQFEPIAGLVGFF